MASRRVCAVALMSIKPVFADRILSGQKKVEFRRTRFARAVSHVVIYATSPRNKVIGFFEVVEVDKGPPDELWARYADIGGIEEPEFRAYFGDESQGFAIRVGRVVGLSAPIALENVGVAGSAPQSFRYIDPAALAQIVPRGSKVQRGCLR